MRTKPRLYEYQERMGMLGRPTGAVNRDLGMRFILDTRVKTSCVSLVGAPEYRKQLAEMPCRCFIVG